MSKNYRQLTESVRNRTNPDNLNINKAFTDEISTLSYNEVLVYIRYAMKGVEPEYTQKSKDAGERVKTHLNAELSDVVFKYQGSVMTNTHIKGHSDIDLLTISDKFYQYDSAGIAKVLNDPERNSKYYDSSLNKLRLEASGSSYQGNALNDLLKLRLDSERVLSAKYIDCETSKPKAIKIKNRSLNREVDIVIASWYDNVTSIINNKGDYRGIRIYNKETNNREKADYPFLSIKRINERSSDTNGRLKKMIRFLKNIKANSDHDIELSSFDINAICYDIDTSKYRYLSFYELVPVVYNQLSSISRDKTHSDKVVSVDGREWIFKYNSGKLENLQKLLAEVEGIYNDMRLKIGA